MKNLIIQSDLINNRINIVYGFEVDYNALLETKNFNNNGVWGLITNQGEVIDSVSYNPNLHHNFVSDYQINLALMEQKVSVYRLMQQSQIESLINP